MLLVDTGPDITCIAPDVAQAIGMRSMGKRNVSVPTGFSTANTYHADIGIPFGDTIGKVETLVISNVTVMDFLGAHSQYKGLLGRDIINLGLLSIAGWDKRFTFCM